ncbi:MAG: hypothetical protein CMH56_00840 [Myxococcales bacterium]|nr:hypothetical protein [Myxococcales bacterium]|tara:strand:- start:7438 stop:8307 length:870 start_codon:yes stop_codon:yes gene_type:complete
MNDPTPYPPPDTFLLELIDHMNLAFPACLHKAQVHFKRLQSEPLRVALTDLQGEPIPEAPPRIPLGHRDEEILDAINAIVGDLAHSVLQHGNVSLEEGYWDIFPDDVHGGTHVYLVEKGNEDMVRMKRTFDQSELSWLLFTPKLYEALGAQIETIQQRQQELSALLEGVQDFRFDLAKGKLELIKDGGHIQLEVHLLGSWLQGTGGFLWGWANPNCPAPISEAITRFKEKNSQPGLRLFYKPEVGGPESMAHLLSEHAALEVGLRGTLRIPFSSENGSGFMYLGVTETP